MHKKCPIFVAVVFNTIPLLAKCLILVITDHRGWPYLKIHDSGVVFPGLFLSPRLFETITGSCACVVSHCLSEFHKVVADPH